MPDTIDPVHPATSLTDEPYHIYIECPKYRRMVQIYRTDQIEDGKGNNGLCQDCANIIAETLSPEQRILIWNISRIKETSFQNLCALSFLQQTPNSEIEELLSQLDLFNPQLISVERKIRENEEIERSWYKLTDEGHKVQVELKDEDLPLGN